MDPPEDFRDLDIVPNSQDVCSDREPFLTPNIIGECYQSAEKYLDIHFRLLREDFLYPLRRSILKMKIHGHQNVMHIKGDGVRIYFKVKIRSTSENIYTIRFSANEMEESERQESHPLASGSLLLLSADNFQSVICCTVMDSEGLSKGFLRARCVSNNVPKGLTKKNCVMVESVVPLDTYRHVLYELQRLPLNEFPLRDFILGTTCKASKPGYLAHFKKPIYDLSREAIDPSQSAALLSALTNQVAIIQGPPGTGKTLIALKIIKILLENSRFWRRRDFCPILILGHTKGKLVHLFSKMDFTDKITLVGAQSEQLELHLTTREKRNPRRRSRNVDSPRADVVGLTTAEATKNKSLLEELKPIIVIVVEAAMILEAHVVAALTSSCEHLIMIGDGKQQKPSACAHLSGEPYHLNVSLFERLINLGLEPSVLDVQHRMRPEVSRLIVPFIYSNLQDAESVQDYPAVRGMRQNVFFKMHEHQMTENDERNRPRCYELDMALCLARYLLLQGYTSNQITILSVEQRVHFEASQPVHITTVDDYKGENDIIILCLMRRRGTLAKIENRVCVGLSRAKQGFYVIGDMNALSKKSNFWKQVRRVLRDNGQLGWTLPLKCQRHGNIMNVNEKDDFPADGGCGIVCHDRMPCGHICQKMCHPDDPDHLKMICKDRCLRLCPKGHSCSKLCCEPCDPCVALIENEFHCGHRAVIRCHRRSTASCEEPCPRKCPNWHPCRFKCGQQCRPCQVEMYKLLPCGHSMRTECYKDVANERCHLLVSKRLPCEHVQLMECYENPELATCVEPCSRTCERGHPCITICARPCISCQVQVLKDLPCGHEKWMKCYANPAYEVCVEQCSRTCQQGHPCQAVCCKPCPPCEVEVTKQLPCGHSGLMECYLDPSKKPCSILVLKQLPCKHFQEMECRSSSENSICYEKCSRTCIRGHPCWSVCYKPCPPCEVEVTKRLACGHDKLMKCCVNCSKAICTQPCPQSCANGHPCPQICNHQCYPCSVRMVKQLACGHSKEMDCCEDPASQSCTAMVQKELPCGHSTAMECRKSAEEVRCRRICESRRNCGHSCDAQCHPGRSHDEFPCKRHPDCSIL